MQRRAIATLVLLAAAGCAGDEADIPRKFERLELALATARTERPARKRLARLVPTREITPWKVSPSQPRWSEYEHDELEGSLAIPGNVARTLEIPLPARPPGDAGATEPNQIEVAMRLHGRSTMTVSLWRGEERVVSRSLPVAQSAEVTWNVANLGTIPSGDGPCDRLTLELRARGGTWIVHAVDLIQAEPAAGLPAVEDGPELAFVGGEGRRAVALETDRPQRTTFEAEAHNRLSFAIGPTDPRAAAGSRVQVRLWPARKNGKAKGPGRGPSLERDFKLRARAWQQASIDLAELEAGGVIESGGVHALVAEFQLINNRGEASACLLEEPVLSDGRATSSGSGAAAETVLLITSDTHRADHLGSAGLVPVETPVLDELAERGVSFERCWAPTNVTLPSHTALLTGTHPRDTGVLDNLGRLPEDLPRLAERFRDAGYRTFAVASTSHLDHRRARIGVGFDRIAESQVSDRRATDSIQILENWLADVPDQQVFVWLHLFDPHMPYEPPGTPPADAPRTDDEQRGLYRGEIAYMDGELRRILDRERMRAGIVAFTADHGESLGAHGVFFHHLELYPDTLHIPLILSWPQASEQPQRRVPTLVDSVDLGRTLLDLAGLGSAAFPGRNLLDPLLAESESQPRYYIASGASSAAVVAAQRLFVLHLIDHRTPGRRGRSFVRHQVELYDLESDPECEVDLVLERKDEVRKLKALLIAWLAEGRSPAQVDDAPIAAERLRDLEALGYAGMTGGVSDDRLSVPEDCDCAQCESHAE